MLDEEVPFLERAGIEQQFEPLARGELALGVLLRDAALAAARPRGRALLFELPQDVMHRALQGPKRTVGNITSGLRAPASCAEKRQEARRGGDVVAQYGAPPHLLRILAPLLDLEALVELVPRQRPARLSSRRSASASATTTEPHEAVARLSAASAQAS